MKIVVMAALLLSGCASKSYVDHEISRIVAECHRRDIPKVHALDCSKTPCSGVVPIDNSARTEAMKRHWVRAHRKVTEK